MNFVTLIQARTNSTRLPGKALLPVGGVPSAVLASLRAANRGGRTILATSSDVSDNALASSAQQYGVQVFRGCLDDVLGRFFAATMSFAQDDVVVRLTADNVVPDGDFVQELAMAFTAAHVEYLGTDPGQSHLPYGLGAEAFSVAALRKAYRHSTEEFDREHVVPWIRRHCSSDVFSPECLRALDLSHLRCTIDDEEDYRRMVELFSSVPDPIGIGWAQLAHRLAQLPGAPRFRVPFKITSRGSQSGFVLGTAQLGIKYGIVNDSGRPATEEAIKIVHRAIEHGVDTLDTARAYGDSEAVLGEALRGAWRSRARVVTKLDLSAIDERCSTSEIAQRVDASINSSLKALHAEKLDAVLLHEWKHHRAWGGAAWNRLIELKNDGVVRELGASVYEPEEALQALSDPCVKYLQIPMNALDRRWAKAGIDCVAKDRPDVVLYARSAFLQGILLHPASRWPRVAGFNATNCASHLAKLASHFDREGVADLCISYLRSLSWITGIIVGCETLDQLEANLRLFLLPPLTSQQIAELESTFPNVSEVLLNPSKWPAAGPPRKAYAS